MAGVGSKFDSSVSICSLGKILEGSSASSISAMASRVDERKFDSELNLGFRAFFT